jgi:N-acetylglucosamine-6-phosphate deacetylase
MTQLFFGAQLVLPDRLIQDGWLLIEGTSIAALGTGPLPTHGRRVDLHGAFLAPGFVDLHVHGGAGADFMDGTATAFRTVCQAHTRHGTTALLPTTTAADREHLLRFLQVCRDLKGEATGGSTILGAHFYGPYFAHDARGCHPGKPICQPETANYAPYLEFADCIATATVAPELPGAEAFVRACRRSGIRCNAGHSHATFAQVETALEWGVRHVDHLYCAMSDRARLRQTQTYPMRGGLMEATLYFDELTTEVIADGKHLSRELLLLAHKCKGPHRLALVTDSNRALDMPNGDYIFGPIDAGEPIIRRDGVGLMPDNKALASGVMGMDEGVRTFYRMTGVPLHEVVRMASLTPARIAGFDRELGSLEVGKRADLVVLNGNLEVREVYIGGQLVMHTGGAD